MHTRHLISRVGLVATLSLGQPAFGSGNANEPASVKESFEFTGYWRAGYNTDINPLKAPLSEQGVSGFPPKSTRHSRSPNYYNLGLQRVFSNGAKVRFEVDNDGFTPYLRNEWGQNGDASERSNIISLAGRDLRLRELYLQLPVSGDVKLWAGVRKLEWEDIRIFDYLNPFNVNAIGIGVQSGNSHALISIDEAKNMIPNTGGEGENQESFYTRNLTAFGRYEVKLGDSSSLKPMIWIKQFGSSEENAAVNRQEVKGSTQFKVGAIYSSWGNAFWANSGLWFESTPVSTDGSESGTNTSLGAMVSNSYELGDYGLLTGLYAKYTSFKNAQQEYQIADDSESLEPDGNATTNNNIEASFGVQPVYYVTNHLHLALDLNYVMESKKLSMASTNAFFATPIVRYAMNKSTLGTPQIYTSITYGMYDWKVKTDANGDKTDALITTQTGFEVWF